MRFSPLLALLAVLLGVVIENTAELGQRNLEHLLGLPAATIGAALLALLAAAWAWWALRGDRTEWTALTLRLVRFLPALALADTLRFYPQTKPATWTAASGTCYLLALAALVAAAAWPRVPRAAIAGLGLAIGLALRLFLILHDRTPLAGDMQALVDAAAGELLRGRAPYHWYYLPWGVPLTYLPGTLLAYVPGRALGLAPRGTNLVAEVVLAALLVLAARDRQRPRLEHPALLIVASTFLLQGPLEWFRLTAHVPGWTLLAAALVLTARRHRAVGPVWGLALATSVFAAPFFPLAAVATAHERGWRAALAMTAQAAAVTAVLVLPFVLSAPQDFYTGAVAWFGDVGRFPALRWSTLRTWREYPGLAGLFWTLGLERWLQRLQVVAVAALVALFWRKGGRSPAVPAFGVAVFLAFMICNHMLWPYFYQPAIVAALCALVTAPAASNQIVAAGSISARSP